MSVPTICKKCRGSMVSICHKNSPVELILDKYRSVIVCTECGFEISGEQQEEELITV